MPDSFTELASALRRDLESILAAPVLGGSDDPLSAVRASVDVQTRVGDLVAAAVGRARASGCTWQQIGEALGMSRQAAFQRFGRPVDPRTGETMSTTPLPEAGRLAETVIDDLAHARWTSVVARFDGVMAEKLDEEGLAAAWAQVIAMAGAYEGHADVSIARAADFTVTTTPLAFEAGDFVARIAFRDDQTIAGLFLLRGEEARR